MELPIIPERLKKIWDVWDLRVSIIGSLLLQVLLVLLSAKRQRSRSTLLSWSIWSSYLLADWVAAVAIGLITKSLGDPKSLDGNELLFTLWASFLLLHLGGPDGITSLSLEDNELWIRHLFGLILQVLSAAYSFYLTLAENRLWLPTVLVFVAGNIKFAERTRALQLASLKRFGATTLPDADPGPDYEEAVSIYRRSVQVQTQVDQMIMVAAGNYVNYEHNRDIVSKTNSERLDEVKLLEVAYSWYEVFKGLIVGFLVSSKDRESSRSFFIDKMSSESAFRLVEYELSFMYQVLHTKAVVLNGTTGHILRAITFFSISAAALLFLFVEKHGFGDFEIIITYALFIGAIVLDAVSIVKLVLSDWILMNHKESWIIRCVPTRFLRRKRWSRLVPQENMIRYCLSECLVKQLYNFRQYLHKHGITETVKLVFCLSSSETITRDLERFIYDELKSKSLKASSARDAIEACSQRGNSALLQSSSSYVKLKWSIAEYQYTESLLLWHLATELCCHDSEANPSHERRICKLLSDYTFYLLVKNPAMLAPVLGNWDVVFRDTCAEANRFFVKHKVRDHEEACKKIISVEPKLRSAVVKRNRSKSLLFDACILAQQLQTEKDHWKLMSRVWVELLSYAAVNCRPFVHAQQLSKGGELLTFTWLLMNHLGLGMQFSEQEQLAGGKMATIIESKQ